MKLRLELAKVGVYYHGTLAITAPKIKAGGLRPVKDKSFSELYYEDAPDRGKSVYLSKKLVDAAAWALTIAEERAQRMAWTPSKPTKIVKQLWAQKYAIVAVTPLQAPIQDEKSRDNYRVVGAIPKQQITNITEYSCAQLVAMMKAAGYKARDYWLQKLYAMTPKEKAAVPERAPWRTPNPERERDFDALAAAQRDVPEATMLKATHILGGGVMGQQLEHIGDLTHRLSEFDGKVAWGTAVDKVRRGLKALRHSYGFEYEHDQNMVANKRDPKVVNAALQAYSDAHKKLPVYNFLQECGRDAAIYLGERKFAQAENCLSRIQDVIDKGRDEFEKRVTEYNPNYPRKVFAER